VKKGGVVIEGDEARSKQNVKPSTEKVIHVTLIATKAYGA